MQVKREWFTIANALKAYVAVVGFLTIVVANWADAPQGFVNFVAALTAVGVWLVPKENGSPT